MTKEANRPTLKTIAQALGVTANTVSLALKGSPRVKEETRKRVLEVAQEQGYVRDMLASSLREGQSRTIALIFGDIGNPLYAIRIKKLEKIFRLNGYQILILNTNNDPKQEKEVISVVIGRKVDGVVCTPSPYGRAALDLLRSRNIPCVLVGRYFDDAYEDSVVWDNEGGACLAAHYLWNKGCHQPIYIAQELNTISTERSRLSGFVNGLMECGFSREEALSRCFATDYADPSEYVQQKVKLPYDGVFCFNDQIAWAVASCVKESVTVIGFDNMQSVLRLPFGLPSIGADLDVEAGWVAELLLSRIAWDERPKEKRILPVCLVEH